MLSTYFEVYDTVNTLHIVMKSISLTFKFISKLLFQRFWHVISYSILMKNLHAGSRVQALAKNVEGELWAQNKFGTTWDKVWLKGTVCGKKEGPRSRTWVVKWDHSSERTEIASSRLKHDEGCHRICCC